MVGKEHPSIEALEASIRELSAGPPEQAIADLTVVANRAIIELHRVAREQAKAQRGQPEWGSWARLANAVRSGVLQVAAIRDSVKGLGLSPNAGSVRPGGEPAAPSAGGDGAPATAAGGTP